MSELYTAAGFVLAHIQDRAASYLLMRSASHGNWLPPKGHTDEGESVMTTALRELEEETGIRDVTKIDGFEGRIEYDVDTKRGRYHKVVTYMLATTPATNVVRSPEHDDCGWFALDDALEKTPFSDMQRVLKQADAHLRQAGLID